MTAPPWLVARPVAHRGLHDKAAGIPENTLSAAEAAIAAGYAIECDVQDSADGEAMVFHDPTLDRLTAERGPVRARRAGELSRLPVARTDDRIPTLQAFLARIAGRVPVVIEIKSRFDGATALSQRTCEVVAAYDGPVALKSFDPAVVAAVRRLAPGLPRGIVAQACYEGEEWAGLDPGRRRELAHLLHFEETWPDFVSWRVGDLPCAAPFLCRVLGRLPVMAWTVRTDADQERARRYADQIVFEGLVPSS